MEKGSLVTMKTCWWIPYLIESQRYNLASIDIEGIYTVKEYDIDTTYITLEEVDPSIRFLSSMFEVLDGPKTIDLNSILNS